MHACGHDFHLSIALGAAKLLSRLRDRLAGQFRFIFQPAEERPAPDGLSGARAMVAAGVLEQDPPVAAILALHVAPNLEAGQIRYGSEVVMAGADRITLTIAGKSAHGATPHRGVDPILVSALVLNHIQAFLAQQIDPRAAKVLTFGRINGGNRFNILADEVTLVGSLRYLQDATRTELLNGLRRRPDGSVPGHRRPHRAGGRRRLPHPAQRSPPEPPGGRGAGNPAQPPAASSRSGPPWGAKTLPFLPPRSRASISSWGCAPPAAAGARPCTPRTSTPTRPPSPGASPPPPACWPP